MLLDSQQLRSLELIPGTRMLVNPILTPGLPIMDFREPWRHWSFHWMYAPISGRKLGGVRAKVVDHKGFTAFINQRDLEVALGHGKAGSWCSWLGQDYRSPSDRDWYGMCCDEEDLKDDMFEKECLIRQELANQLQNGVLPKGLEVKRRLHLDQEQDVEDLDVLLWDMDPDTGYSPDTRIETLSKRWARADRTRLIWERL